MTLELRHGVATIGLVVGLISVVFGAACHAMMLDQIAKVRGAKVGVVERMGLGVLMLVLEYRRVCPGGRLHWPAFAASVGGMAMLFISGGFGWAGGAS